MVHNFGNFSSHLNVLLEGKIKRKYFTDFLTCLTYILNETDVLQNLVYFLIIFKYYAI